MKRVVPPQDLLEDDIFLKPSSSRKIIKYDEESPDFLRNDEAELNCVIEYSSDSSAKNVNHELRQTQKNSAKNAEFFHMPKDSTATQLKKKDSSF